MTKSRLQKHARRHALGVKTLFIAEIDLALPLCLAPSGRSLCMDLHLKHRAGADLSSVLIDKVGKTLFKMILKERRHGIGIQHISLLFETLNFHSLYTNSEFFAIP